MDDTDTLLALLASLLDPVPSHAVLLDALIESDGDVERAATSLRKNDYASKQQAEKRKRSMSIQGWLKASPRKPTSAGPSTSSSKPPSKRVRTAPHGSVAVKHEEERSVLPIDPSSSSLSGIESVQSTSRVKPVSQSELMHILRPPNSKELKKPVPPRLPPLTLATPSLVAENTSCTLHVSVLPPELACRLFHTMIRLSDTWQKNKWWLFDRVVESPHRTSFYARHVKPADGMQEAAQFWYNGRQTEAPPQFPPPMEEACEIIERVVNAEMRKRPRYAAEWGGEPSQEGEGTGEKIIWRANVAAANCYEGGKESVGPHSDQLTYLGPYPTIASLSLGTNRIFRLREVIPADEKETRSARTFNIPLAHNTLTIMHASTQEVFKHSIPPQAAVDLFHPPFPPPDSNATDIPASNCRINITFRFYRPDFRAQLTPRCKCGVPCILRPDMKNRYSEPGVGVGEAGGSNDNEGHVRKDQVVKYWWTCYAGAQNDGKGCNFWKVMDMQAEGRGPFVGSP